MFRTRDYAVILGIIAFLVVAIAVTVVSPFGFGRDMAAAIFVATNNDDVTYDAGVERTEEVSREDRISALKKKIAALALPETQTELEPVVEESPLPELPKDTNESEVASEERCSGYYASTVVWNPKGLRISEVEGARLVYREIVTAGVGSSTEPVIAKDVVAQLPLRSLPSGGTRCIATDVIGIATDGSLIRNGEVGAYGVFGAGTLVGYALDGFPIYGKGDSKTDICGGSVVGGQYRYTISSDRDTIINCYAGTPVTL